MAGLVGGVAGSVVFPIAAVLATVGAVAAHLTVAIERKEQSLLIKNLLFKSAKADFVCLVGILITELSDQRKFSGSFAAGWSK